VFYEQDEAESESSSRAESSAGDDQRLGDSSHNGSSSAYQGRGASRQGADGSNGMNPAEGNDLDKPPEYSTEIQNGETVLEETQLVEDMDEVMEDEEGIEPYHSYRIGPVSPFSHANWDFRNIQRSYRTDGSYIGDIPAPPGSDEGLADDSLSTGAANGSEDEDGPGIDLQDRINDFDDEGFNGHGFETASQSGQGFYSITDSPTQEDPPTYEELEIKAPVAVGEVLDEDGDDDAPVAEVHVEEGEGLVAG
jgi:ubiquitin carboxyl-terminal hydrolase 4/11